MTKVYNSDIYALLFNLRARSRWSSFHPNHWPLSVYWSLYYSFSLYFLDKLLIVWVRVNLCIPIMLVNYEELREVVDLIFLLVKLRMCVILEGFECSIISQSCKKTVFQLTVILCFRWVKVKLILLNSDDR